MAQSGYNSHRTYFIPPATTTTGTTSDSKWVRYLPTTGGTEYGWRFISDDWKLACDNNAGEGLPPSNMYPNILSDEYETVGTPGGWVLRRKDYKAPNKDALEEYMEILEIDDTCNEGRLDDILASIPDKGWYTKVSSDGIEYYTILSGTFRMKDIDILKEISANIHNRKLVWILLNHESKNPVDPDAIRVYYSKEVESGPIVTSEEVTELVDRKNTYFLGYIPGERGEYLNRILTSFWKENKYSNTKVEPIAFFHSIKAPGKDARFWNILLKITLLMPYKHDKLHKLEL